VPNASITSFGTAVTENFNGLAASGLTGTTVPNGVVFVETGANANTTYAVGTGSENGGNTYSYGSTGSTDRALGTLLSGSLVSTIGLVFTNDTGGTITSLTITYTGEQWRLGATSPPTISRPAPGPTWPR
jgi:hypothetical protein